MSFALKITEPSIGLTDRTNYVNQGDFSGFTFTNTKSARGSASCNFVVKSADTYAPVTGCPIFLYDGGAVVWAGTIDQVQLQYITNGNDRVYALTCVSLEQVFDAIFPPAQGWFNVTAGSIVSGLLSGPCAGVPVTAGTISAGPTIPALVTDGSRRVSDLFDELATGSGFVWYVKPSTQTLQFALETTTAAPFTILQSDIKWASQGSATVLQSSEWKQTRQNYRNRQGVRISFDAFSDSNEVLPGLGPGFTTFNTRIAINKVTAASLTTSTQASVVGTFTGQPANNDTITINDAVYTFKTALDNTQLAQILIGANLVATLGNIQDAVNSNPVNGGLTFSLPTWENDACFVSGFTSTAFTIKVKWAGSGGNGVAVAKSCTNFSWAASTTSGGTDGTTTALQVGVTGAAVGKGLTYTVGSTTVMTALYVPIGTMLSIQYQRLGGDTIWVENTAQVTARAAVEHGSGKYQQLVSDSQNTSAAAGLLEAQQALAGYGTLLVEFTIEIRKTGLQVGQQVLFSVSTPSTLGVLVNSGTTWVVQQIDVSLVPGDSQLWYKVSVISTVEMQSYIKMWEQLTATGNNASSSSAAVTGSGDSGGGGITVPPPSGLAYVPALYNRGQFSVDSLSLLDVSDIDMIDFALAFVDELTADVYATVSGSVSGSTDPVDITVTPNPAQTSMSPTFAAGGYLLFNDPGSFEIGLINTVTNNGDGTYTYNVARAQLGTAKAAHGGGSPSVAVNVFVVQVRRFCLDSQSGSWTGSTPPSRFDITIPAACVCSVIATPHGYSSGYGSAVTTNMATATLPGLRTLTGLITPLQVSGTLAAGAGTNLLSCDIRFDDPFPVRVVSGFVKTAPTGHDLTTHVRISLNEGTTWTNTFTVTIPAGSTVSWPTSPLSPPENQVQPYSGAWPFPIIPAGSRMNVDVSAVGTTIAGANLTLTVDS